MTPTVCQLASHTRLIVPDDHPTITTFRDATDLIGEALSDGASVIAVAVSSLDESFFQLRTGFAGEVLQKAANYHIKFAVVGDVCAHTAASNAFHDLVAESQHSRDHVFVPDMAALETRLPTLRA